MDKLPQIPSPPGTAFREFRIRVVPFLVFAAVLVATIVLWRRYVGPGSLVGTVQATRSAVVSTVPARVSVLKVHLLDPVGRGQPVAEVVPADTGSADPLSKPIVLVSPIEGFVSFIGHVAGESVLAGDPIVIVSASKPERIIAYQRQPLRLSLRPGMAVEVRARSFGRVAGQGQVLGVGAQMETIPAELLPTRPGAGSAPVEYGQPVVVSLPAGLRVLPGEIVDLRPLPGGP
ncbi:MAG: hypothetical protein DVB31_02340 [Verrucomicrobia bacterium]|nr:MAG: hypothetical protein DVB31_02340 [Verrucomicrobiota bacterium]